MKRGFTLSELMLVVTIIAILAIFTLLTFQRQTMRGYDSKRKTDLANFKAMFEDYYNDHTCYPTKELWDAYDCQTKANGDFLKPYLGGKDLPCDPQTNERYLYIALPEATANACSGYKLFAALGNLADLDIPGSGCDPSPYKGCGYGPPDYPPPASFKYNYGISAGGTIVNPLFDFEAPPPTPTPTSAFPPGNWICPPNIGNAPPQNCQYYSDCCRDLMITRCSTYDTPHKNDCSALCNPGQQNVCNYLSECYSQCP